MKNKKHFSSVVFIFSSGYDASIPNRVLVRSRERAYQPDLTRIEAKIDWLFFYESYAFFTIQSDIKWVSIIILMISWVCSYTVEKNRTPSECSLGKSTVLQILALDGKLWIRALKIENFLQSWNLISSFRNIRYIAKINALETPLWNSVCSMQLFLASGHSGGKNHHEQEKQPIKSWEGEKRRFCC